MQQYTIKDLMVPLSEYATVSKGASLYQAVLALENAQERFDHIKYHHRGVLVLDEENQAIGKISQLDVLRALDPKNKRSEKIRELEKYGFTDGFISSMQDHYRPDSDVARSIRTIAHTVKVEEYMQSPTEGEYVEEDTPLEAALHQLVVGFHLSLLVTRNGKLVGVLRLADVFAAVFHTMKTLESK